MDLADTDRTYSIIIIGPMEDKPLTNYSQYTPVSQHLPNIQEAVLLCASEIRKTDPTLVLEPHTAFDIAAGGIANEVMRMMDEADLVIADVSHKSDSTMYEVGMLHSLGTPIIFLDYALKKKHEPPFYVKDQRYYQVDEYETGRLAAVLCEPIRGTIHQIEHGAPAGNPIASYYLDFPLIEASGVTGVATGQFYNFIRHIINDENGAIVENHTEFSKLAIVKPVSLRSAGKIKGEIMKLPGYRGQVSLPATVHPRGMVTVDVIGHTIIDYPTPVSTLQISPRYKAFVARLKHDTPNFATRVARFERKIIARYMSVLTKLSVFEPASDPSLLTFMSVEEIRDAAEAGAL